MKRFVACVYIGTGVDEDFIRPAVDDYDCNWAMILAPDYQTNAKKQWVLCIVAAAQATFDTMHITNEIDVMAFGPDDVTMLWIDLGTRAEREQFSEDIYRLTGIRIDPDDLRTLREIIIEIGTYLNPDFDLDNTTVQDPYG